METKKDVQDQFGKSAESYVTSQIHREGKDLMKLVEIADITGNEKVLDVATGGGHTANALAPLVQNVVALDLTQEMLDAAQKFITGNGYNNVDFIIGDAENLPFPDGTFDIVTCRIAPHHFPNIEKFVSEGFRVLKPNGQLLLDDNVAPEDPDGDEFYNTVEKKRDYSHYRAWKKTEWLHMLELAGFNIQEWHRFEKTFVFDGWCQRMNLTEADKVALNDFMIAAGNKIKQKFHIQINGNQIVSFQGEAILLKATK